MTTYFADILIEALIYVVPSTILIIAIAVLAVRGVTTGRVN